MWEAILSQLAPSLMALSISAEVAVGAVACGAEPPSSLSFGGTFSTIARVGRMSSHWGVKFAGIFSSQFPHERVPEGLL